MVDTNGKQFVQIGTESILQHQEHKAITVPKGKYEVVIQREFDLLEGTRQVMD